jgi:hypothetical protein
MSTSSGTILYHMLPTDAWSLPAQPGNPTLALGVKESRKVLEPILDVKKRGLPVVLISQKPHVFEVADRFNIRSRSSTARLVAARRGAARLRTGPAARDLRSAPDPGHSAPTGEQRAHQDSIQV